MIVRTGSHQPASAAALPRAGRRWCCDTDDAQEARPVRSGFELVIAPVLAKPPAERRSTAPNSPARAAPLAQGRAFAGAIRASIDAAGLPRIIGPTGSSKDAIDDVAVRQPALQPGDPPAGVRSDRDLVSLRAWRWRPTS
jgi:hypothetical protein